MARRPKIVTPKNPIKRIDGNVIVKSKDPGVFGEQVTPNHSRSNRISQYHPKCFRSNYDLI